MFTNFHELTCRKTNYMCYKDCNVYTILIYSYVLFMNFHELTCWKTNYMCYKEGCNVYTILGYSHVLFRWDLSEQLIITLRNMVLKIILLRKAD